MSNHESRSITIHSLGLRTSTKSLISFRNLINDLENIPTFLILSLIYILTGPTPSIGIWHFRLFAVGRIVHTISYLAALQPFRSIGFLVGFASYLSVTTQIILHALKLF